jgi:putative ABC transport system substrate-binding protein
MPRRIAILHSGRAGGHGNAHHIQKFKDGANLSYDGSGGALNFTNHWGNDDPGVLGQLARDLAGDANVYLIAAAGGTRVAEAAGAATNPGGVKPVVFTSVSTPNRKYANMTGVCARTSLLDPERLKLLYQIKPGSQNFGALINPDRGNIADVQDALNNTAASFGYPFPNYKPVRYNNFTDDLEAAFQFWTAQNYAGVMVTADPLFQDHADDIIDMANNTHPIPTIYQWRDFTESNGLISLGPDLTACYVLAGYYAGRVASGMQPQTLPILSPGYEVVVNLSTVKALTNSINFILPAQVLNQATDVIT